MVNSKMTAKLIHVLAISSPVLANYQIMQESLQAKLNATSDRALANFMVAGLNNFKNYGCWCFLDGAPGKGRSGAIDAFDMKCKTLHDGYQCIEHDAISENDGDCLPWEQNYAFQFDNQDVSASCFASNSGNNCAARACIVEQSFIEGIFEIFFSGVSINIDFKHSNGFDTAVECPIKKCAGGSCDSVKACCGNYPVRAMYRTYGGDRQCCGAKVFDTDVMECCANADQFEVKLVGSC